MPRGGGQKTKAQVKSQNTADLIKAAVSDWIKNLHTWFPRLHEQTYFFPPLHFNKVLYTDVDIGGQSVLVPQPLPNKESSQENPGDSSQSSPSEQSNPSSATDDSSHSDHSETPREKTKDDEQFRDLSVTLPAEGQKSPESGTPLSFGPTFSRAKAEGVAALDKADATETAFPEKNKAGEVTTPSRLCKTSSQDADDEGASACVKCAKDSNQDTDAKAVITAKTNGRPSPGKKNDNTAPCMNGEKSTKGKQRTVARNGNQSKQAATNPPLASVMWLIQPEKTKKKQILSVVPSDLRDDIAHRLVLQFLHHIADDYCEIMFVISHLNFARYLVEPSKEHKKAVQELPKAKSLPTDDPKEKRGDFDILIIHPRYGLVIFEVKSVGGNPEHMPKGSDDEIIAKKVARAVRQLEKAEIMLRYLVSDLETPVRITKTLTVPNITSQQLLHALEADQALAQDLCQCLDAQSVEAAVERCLCYDNLCQTALGHSSAADKEIEEGCSAKENGTDAASEIRECVCWSWWTRTVTDKGPDKNMTKDLYEQLIARFGGPATTIEVPTVTPPRGEVRVESQAIAHTGLVMARLTLYPDQVDIVFSTDRLVFLTGPPGTGKSVVLAVKGLTWLKEGKDVHLVVTQSEAHAVSCLMKRQLESCLDDASAGHVFLHKYYLEEGDEERKKWVEQLAAAAEEKGGELYVIADEAANYRFDYFCDELWERVPRLHLWAATVQRGIRPKCLVEHVLTTPLRCTPVVEKEVSKSQEMGVSVLRYGERPSPAPTEGPPVERLPHKNQTGHTRGPPEKCLKCGENIAELLKKWIGTGESDLQYRDVLLMCRNPTEHIGLVKGLRAKGIPLKIIRESDFCDVPSNPGDAETDDSKSDSGDDIMESLALAKEDKAIVTTYNLVQGLERRIVIGTGDQNFANNGLYQLYAMSRCTSQLVWIGDMQ